MFFHRRGAETRQETRRKHKFLGESLRKLCVSAVRITNFPLLVTWGNK